MAKFFVGMRVRLVGSEWLGFGPSPAGREARIIKKSAIGVNSRRMFDWGLMADDYGYVQANSHELEPILPEGAAPSIYSYQELMDKLREGERV